MLHLLPIVYRCFTSRQGTLRLQGNYKILAVDDHFEGKDGK